MKKTKKRSQSHNTFYPLIMVPVLFFIFVIILGNNGFLGFVADAVIHPVLGEKNTLFLESVYFGLQDKWNQLQYKYLNKTGPSFVQTVSEKTKQLSNAGQMDLEPISLRSELPTLKGEGIWSPIAQNLYPDQTVIAKTYIRPDPSRPYATVFLVKMDMKKLGIGTQAGTYYPGGTRKMYGPGVVPKYIQQNNILLAVFNGGFQEKDGHYGMVVMGKTYVPLRINMPALFIYANGSFSLSMYTVGANTATASAVRQNGPYLVHNGLITPYVEQGIDTWGRTITNSMYTWRSGLGVTKNGNLIYAVGNSLVPQTLAKALLAAGAADAIQLDINPPWVRFITYQPLGNGLYTFTPLITSMNGGKQFLTGYNKDFFYIYKK